MSDGDVPEELWKKLGLFPYTRLRWQRWGHPNRSLEVRQCGVGVWLVCQGGLILGRFDNDQRAQVAKKVLTVYRRLCPTPAP
jgi:hypothetical protein